MRDETTVFCILAFLLLAVLLVSASINKQKTQTNQPSVQTVTSSPSMEPENEASVEGVQKQTFFPIEENQTLNGETTNMTYYFRSEWNQGWDPHISDSGGSGVLTGVNNICEVGQWDWADWRTWEGTWVEPTTDQFISGEQAAKFSLLASGTRPLSSAQHCKVWSITKNWPQAYHTAKEAYYANYYWFPSNFTVASWRLIMQWAEPYTPRPAIPTVSLVFQGSGQNLQLHNKGGYTPTGSSRNWNTGYTDDTIPKEQWVKIVVYMNQSSGYKVADGTAQVYIDDELVIDTDEVANYGYKQAQYSYMDYVWSVGNYGSSSEAQGQFLYMDATSVTDAYPTTPTPETPEDPTPPIPPPPPDYYHVSISTTTGGQVTPEGSFDVLVGQNFTAVATPNTDYLMSYWERNGANVGTDYTYTMNDGVKDATYYLIAYFTANPPVEPDPPTAPATNYFSVNIGTGTGGSTSLTGEQTLLVSNVLTVVATPDQNYRFSYWLLDGSNWGTDTTFTLEGAADTSYTLLPVFTYVPPPAPSNVGYSLPSAHVGKLSSGNLLAALMVAQKRVKPITFSNIFKKLRKRF